MDTTTSKPQVEQATDFITDSIQRGDFDVDSLLPSAETIARDAECSVHAVRRAVRTLADEGLLKSVRGRGTTVLRKPYLGNVVMLLSRDADSNTIFQFPVSHALYEAGFDVDIYAASFSNRSVERRLEEAVENGGERPDALVCIAPEGYGDDEKAAFKRYAMKFPARVFFQYEPNVIAPPAFRVLCDPVHASRCVVDHLLELGHRRIAAHGGRFPGEGSSAERRALTLRHLAEVAGAECHIFYGSLGQKESEFIRERGATAYWTMTDDAALGAVNELLKAGISVPEEVSVIGMNNTSLAEGHGISLTSVSLNPKAVAESMAEGLRTAHRGEGEFAEDGIYVKPELVARGSTVAPPKS
ncbi:MAG: substrate-binding domain-containing protein [Candidatus Brocadiia bacterium]